MKTALLFLLLLSHACSLAASAHVLLTKRDPRSALAWVATLLFLPLGGFIIYLIFGIGRAQSRAEQIMRQLADISRSFVLVHSHAPISSLTSAESRLLNELGRNLSDVALCGGNSIEPLINGDEAYPAMLAAIAAAKQHVFLGSYIFNNGHAGSQFIAALTAAHERGVDVRVLVDGVGSLYSWHKPVKILARRGIKTTLFRPFRLWPPSLGINLRSHRKNLVCDDVAFMGGMNIADGNLLNYEPRKKGKIQDMHFRCMGPAVGQIRRAFLMNWAFCTHEFTPLPPLEAEAAGHCDCRVVIDGPGKDGDALNDLICGAVNISQKQIRIMTPYFLPPPSLASALISAGQRGVDVRIIVPGRNNLLYMAWACERILPALLRAGVRVWQQAPPFAHTKLFTIDGFYSIIGSANMDSRSLLLNFELNMEVYNRDFHDLLGTFMDAAMKRGQEITLDAMDRLSLPARLRNSACWLFSPYL